MVEKHYWRQQNEEFHLKAENASPSHTTERVCLEKRDQVIHEDQWCVPVGVTIFQMVFVLIPTSSVS
jgi:hypothetical protein